MFGIWIKDIINCIPQQYHCITQQWQTPAMHSSRRRYRTENIPSPATSYPSPSASSSILLTNLHWNTQLSRRLWDVSVFSLLWSKLLIISIRCYTREEVSWRMRSELMQFSFLSTIIWQIWYSVVNQHIFLWVFLYFFTFPFFNIQFQ